MKKLLLPLLLFTGVQMASAQSREESRKAVLAQPQSLQVKASPAENSPYYGFDNKIKEMTLSGNIPTDFPKREDFVDRKGWLAFANEWLKVHQSLIKTEFKNTELKD